VGPARDVHDRMAVGGLLDLRVFAVRGAAMLGVDGQVGLLVRPQAVLGHLPVALVQAETGHGVVVVVVPAPVLEPQAPAAVRHRVAVDPVGELPALVELLCLCQVVAGRIRDRVLLLHQLPVGILTAGEEGERQRRRPGGPGHDPRRRIDTAPEHVARGRSTPPRSRRSSTPARRSAGGAGGAPAALRGRSPRARLVAPERSYVPAPASTLVRDGGGARSTSVIEALRAGTAERRPVSPSEQPATARPGRP
jgi:hypothetical protein